MSKKFLGLCASVLLCTNAAAQQQNDTTKIQLLDEVVVSDSRFELKRENSGKTVIKISSEELERNQGRSIAEIINTKSGIEIAGSRGREGTILGVFARGGRGRQVLVLIDGVRVSDPSSSSQEYDLRLLSATNIESIEIIKGAASTLYGTNAATAVINIKTKNASPEKVKLNFQTSRGTNQTSEDQNYDLARAYNGVNLSGTLNKLNYQIAFANRYSEGLSALITPENLEDVFSTFSTDIKLGYRFSDSFTINVYGNQTKLRTDYDESFGPTDAPYVFKSEQKRAGLSSEFKYTNGALHLNTGYADYDSENISAFPSSFKGDNFTADLYNKLSINSQFHTIIGLNYIKDRTEFDTEKEFAILDSYVNMVYVSDFGFNLNIGGRLNNHSEYGNHFVYNVNPSYCFETQNGYLKFLGSYATSYITPSLTQLFGRFGANPDLEPEKNRTLEGGFEFAIQQKLRFSGIYFNRKEENAVIYNNQTGQYSNAVSNIDAQGVELEFVWNPLDKINISGNYTFTERKGDAAIRIPKHKINAGLVYELSEKTNASLNYALTGTRFDTDFTTFENIALPNYSLVDFYVEHQLLSKRLKLFFAMSNVFNEDYTEIIGFTTRGRNVRAGLNLTL
ncbi:TonB-dependent receptor plug domain-containing protein [Maribacter halichondriae]|uniref:TonB-dependent receptor plug domain-containing protein n=1 Tax=Maribacter halichondriae TaxID=2980554 RepID=UPI002359BF06|nr:TonB-dependent receptor plug domain-containing protein [Maribacter sp. Hal144]